MIIYLINVIRSTTSLSMFYFVTQSYLSIVDKTSPPPRPPRSICFHHRWSWHDRLARNAWWRPSLLRITVAGVPAFLAVSER